ncbi:MAG: hypothetical protein U9R75_01470 [Candidatus Thermoplasmatota archaeon]|nr:hypothetical protein [Candidatus Thermoplasmatota archaeon]
MRYPLAEIMVLSLLLPLFCSIEVDAVEEAQFDEGEWLKPTIGTFDISIENESGTFKFRSNVEGGSPPGTDHLNITLGMLNGTEIDLIDGFWIGEGGIILFGNGWKLEALGNASDPWSAWKFRAEITFPMDADLDTILDLFGLFTGEEGGPDVLENGTMPDIDIEDALKALSEMRIYIVARSWNGTGAWGQERRDITDELALELLTFAVNEGLVQEMDDDTSDDDPDDDDTSEKDGSLLIVVSGFAAVLLFIAAITSAVFIFRGRDREG